LVFHKTVTGLNSDRNVSAVGL